MISSASSFRPRLHPPSPWPANILRFHITWPGTAHRPASMEGLTLMRNGELLYGACVDLTDALWSSSRQRLSVIFHPALRKSGLRAAGRHSLMLMPGDHLSISLTGGFCRGPSALFEVRIAEPVTEPLPSLDGKLITVARGTFEPINLNVGRALDQGGLETGFALGQSSDRDLRIVATVESSERGARITPSIPWPDSSVVLRAKPSLEDVCGNRVGVPFEMRR